MKGLKYSTVTNRWQCFVYKRQQQQNTWDTEVCSLQVVHTSVKSSAQPECLWTAGKLGQTFMSRYDLTTLEMCTLKVADPELRHSRCFVVVMTPGEVPEKNPCPALTCRRSPNQSILQQFLLGICRWVASLVKSLGGDTQLPQTQLPQSQLQVLRDLPTLGQDVLQSEAGLLGQVEVADSGVVVVHDVAGARGRQVALGDGRHPVLAGVEQPPVVAVGNWERRTEKGDSEWNT